MPPPLPPDPYKILGVSKTAQIPDIRAAHRKLVLTCHPDKVQDPELKEKKLDEFQKIQRAYELLSDEKERTKYDDQVKLVELRKEAAKANTSAPRTPKPTQTYSFSIRTAEQAKSSPYAQSPPRGAPKGTPKAYDYHRNSSSDSVFIDEKIPGRTARRTPSYEKPPSRKDKDRDEERERDRERERVHRRRKDDEREERERERDRDRRAEKEARKADKKRQDKERKHSYEEKRHRHRSPQMYVEEYEDEAAARSSEKKSSSRRRREREPTPVVEEAEDKVTDKMGYAASYIRERKHPNIVRAATFDSAGLRSSPPSAPTPPPPRDPTYAPPPPPLARSHTRVVVDDDDEDDFVPRSRGPPSRRNSHDPPRSTERAFLVRPGQPAIPVVVESSLEDMVAETPRFHKSNTFHEVHRSMPRPINPPTRANTYSAGEALGPRGRSRNRHHAQRVHEQHLLSEEEDEEEERRSRYKHRSSKRDPSVEYSYSGSYGTEGSRSYGGRESYRPSPPDHRPSKVYYTSSPRGAVVEPHPGVRYSKVKTRKTIAHEDINYGRYGQFREPQSVYH